ncbi:MAG TPA: DUF309 domain-containing protein [Blastocatellia bacterium]|nr:DUF309 domain-containing protein [Blastocatellia bacterium]
MASLRFESGPRAGEEIPLGRDKITFGRSLSCDCVLAHPTVSREHFYVERNNGKLFLVDQGSENGTFANAERVSWVELKHGDTVRAGPFTLVLEMITSRPGSAKTATMPTTGAVQDYPSHFDLITAGHYPVEYIEGIDHFNAGRYFDAHEVWEEIWLRSSGDTKVFYQMLIQAAVGLHHHQRGNPRGARAMHANVVEKLGRLPAMFMSLDLADFSQQFRSFLAALIEDNNEAAPTDKPRPQIRLLDRDSGEWSL